MREEISRNAQRYILSHLLTVKLGDVKSASTHGFGVIDQNFCCFRESRQILVLD
jgi:hypothetical protein